eukprot:GEMP01049595.1.p1 GENE.GEMP01049595.1~~GEMP01049595.1.p1  ORF type:complete len:342 (+),score=71.93 GEMP01049595.1:72-1028(+)
MALTDAQLAIKVEEIWHGESMPTYANYQPIEEVIARRNRLFIESDETLFILHRAASENFEEKLKKLKYGKTIRAMRLHPIRDSDEDDIPKKEKVKAFNFANIYDGSTSLLPVYLPSLTIISMSDMNICNFTLKALPSVRKLSLMNTQFLDDTWFLELPYLTSLILEQTTPPLKAFAQSLVRCPRIESFFLSHHWAPDDFPALYLPNCTDFSFRGHCVPKLSLYLPRVKVLYLNKNGQADNITLLEQGNAAMKEFNLRPGESPSTFPTPRAHESIPVVLKYFQERSNAQAYVGLKDAKWNFGQGSLHPIYVRELLLKQI